MIYSPPRSSSPLNQNKENEVSNNHISALRTKHAELEQRLEREEARPQPDSNVIHALKKQKLIIKDEIAQGALA